MSGAVVTAVAVSAAVGVATAAYTTHEQKKAAKKERIATENARAETQAAAIEAEDTARTNEKLLRDASAESETASITFGTEDDEEIGTYNDFISKAPRKKATTGLSTGSGSGLGFGV